jgi:hypothetical protein
VRAGFKGRASPKVSIGATVFKAQNEILVHSSIRHNWCFPVSVADTGYTPAQVARKEVLEQE